MRRIRGAGSRLMAIAAIAAIAVWSVACHAEPDPAPAASSHVPSASSSASPVPRTPVRFRDSDGVRIDGSMFGSGRVGVVLGHGSDGDQRDWWNFAETLARSGYAALSIDYRSYCPGRSAGCSGDGSTSDAWMDMLGGARYLKDHDVKRVVLMGSSMGGTASVVAAAQPDAGIAGVISLSGSTDCCGMDAGRQVVRRIEVPMLFVAGRFDFGFAAPTRHWGRWTGPSAEAVIVASGEHGVDFFQLATPAIQRQVTELVMDFLARVSER
jgi:pimeloyl-ACP methyl ester carboxylesterase